MILESWNDRYSKLVLVVTIIIIGMDRRWVTNTGVPYALRVVFCKVQGKLPHPMKGRISIHTMKWHVASPILGPGQNRGRRGTSEISIYDLIWKGYIRLFVSVP
jgi:hypothetical protein